MPASPVRNESGAETSRQIIATREFDAPRDLVFSLWTSPDHIARWWGPDGFTTTIQTMDVRPGGEWNFVLHGPDGQDYVNKNIYREVVRPERIHYSHISGPVFDSVIVFEEIGSRTRVTVTMTFATAELRNRVVEQYGAVEGLHQTLGRLAEQVAKNDEFVITRVFDAPRELVFSVWTSADHLQNWFGPKGVTIFGSRNDLRPGGIYHYGMRTPDGGEMWGRWVYREISPPARLVFVNSFSDKDGGLARVPAAEPWPSEMLSTVTFDDQDGKTAVTIRWIAINATAEERKTFASSHASMNEGWGGTFEKLAAYLRQRKG